MLNISFDSRCSLIINTIHEIRTNVLRIIEF